MSLKTARQAATAVVKTLTAAGYQALLAGGCVRDLLLGMEPEDYDVATTAHPDDICRLFPRAQRVGAHFGVILVHRFRHQIEVATFRREGPYLDGRHPEQVTFCSAEQDARRRDFTVNGMFYDLLTDQVLDYVDGRPDLAARRIQAIGQPEDRFEEDHLRMLRAVRLAARLDFEIEQDTFEAMHARAHRIARISAERIRDELERILSHPTRARGFDLLCESGLLLHLWPNARWSTATLQCSRRALECLPAAAGTELATAAMLHHQEPRSADRICRALTYSNRQRKAVVWLLEHLEQALQNRVESLADLKLLMANVHFADLLELYAACLLADGRDVQPARDLAARSHAVPAEAVAPDPLVTGDDLLALGLTGGPRFKELLDECYRAQLNLTLVSRAQALELLRRRLT